MGTKRRPVENIVIYVILTIFAVVVLFPFFWMFIVSLKTLPQYLERPIQLLGFTPNFENYRYAFETLNLLKHTGNSLLVSTSVVVFQVVTSCFAAYSFSLLRYPGKNVLFGVVMATMMIPGAVMLIPLYLIVNNLGLGNSYLAMILPFGFSGFSCFIMRQSFMALPGDLKSAAEIDGAGHLRILWQIYFPLVRPNVMALIIIVFIQIFNSLLWPSVVISNEAISTLPMRMVAMVSFDRFNDQTKILSVASICVIPPMIVFIALQKFFVKGYVLSGIKG